MNHHFNGTCTINFIISIIVCKKFIVVIPWHHNINVIVPRDKPFVSNSPQHSPIR